MLADIAASRVGFWIVALTIAFVDSAMLIAPGQFAFSLSRTNRAKLRIASSPFTLRNKELAISILSFPFTMFFISDVRVPEESPEQTRRDLSAMRRLTRRTKTLTVLSSSSAIALAMGPIAALFYGVSSSVIIFLPVLYVIAFASSILIWLDRNSLGLSGTTAAKLALEMSLCPVLSVNILKKISQAQTRIVNTQIISSYTVNPCRTASAVSENLNFYNGTE